MTSPLGGQFSEEKVKGMFSGPRATKGRDGAGDLTQVSGTTYGGQGLGWYWQGYPNITGGLTEYDKNVTETGSNMQAVMSQPKIASESKVGGGRSKAQIPDYGGTAAY
jgi:hypothetical protein